ncbi:NACHT domain-containing protein [Micromonospora sp. CA-244673]|uniref:NACHT domain-containing protein n=1 Tax=Micromonospora sp. CA-244673 TaxID=3239958 RepID=UPI003D8DD9AA
MIAGPVERTRRTRYVLISLFAALVGLTIWLSSVFGISRMPAAVTAILLAIPTLYLSWRTFYEARVEALNTLTVTRIAQQLAQAVGGKISTEIRDRRINDPHPLPVSWVPADPVLVEDWQYLVTTAVSWGASTPTHRKGWARGVSRIAGTGNQLAGVLRRIPTRRLVVLGEPGAGKSVLLLRLVADILANYQEGDAVPVLLPVTSWDPQAEDLHRWLVRQLVERYPATAARLRTDAGFVTGAQALTDAGLVLPVLDGLDEMKPYRRLRSLDCINAALRPAEGIVVSCRTDNYREIVDGGGDIVVKLRGATGIQLANLEGTDVEAYLRRASNLADPKRWACVFKKLGTDTPVGRVLRSPLTVSLARSIYVPRPGDTDSTVPDPSEICDEDRFRDDDQLKLHLFERYLPAVYRTEVGRVPRWGVERATHTLRRIAATGARREDEAAFTWWSLTLFTPTLFMSSVLAIADFFAVGLGLWPLSGPRFGLAAAVVNSTGVLLYSETSHRIFPRYGRRVVAVSFSLVLAVVVTAVGWVIHNMYFGLAVGTVNGLLAYLGARVLENQRLTPSKDFQLHRGDVLVGSAFGLTLGVVVSVVAASGTGSVSFAMLTGALVAVVAGLAASVGLGLNTSGADLEEIDEPFSAVARERRLFLMFTFGSGLLMGSTVSLLGMLNMSGFAAHLIVPTRQGEVTVMTCGALGGLAAGLLGGLMKTPWGNYFASKCYLAARHGFPLNLLTFLDDACRERGVLRYSGGAYQFRHVELQRHLAAQFRSLKRRS